MDRPECSRLTACSLAEIASQTVVFCALGEDCEQTPPSSCTPGMRFRKLQVGDTPPLSVAIV